MTRIWHGIDMAAAFPSATAAKLDRAYGGLMRRAFAAQGVDDHRLAEQLALAAHGVAAKVETIRAIEAAR